MPTIRDLKLLGSIVSKDTTSGLTPLRLALLWEGPYPGVGTNIKTRIYLGTDDGEYGLLVTVNAMYTTGGLGTGTPFTTDDAAQTPFAFYLGRSAELMLNSGILCARYPLGASFNLNDAVRYVTLYADAAGVILNGLSPDNITLDGGIICGGILCSGIITGGISTDAALAFAPGGHLREQVIIGTNVSGSSYAFSDGSTLIAKRSGTGAITADRSWQISTVGASLGAIFHVVNYSAFNISVQDSGANEMLLMTPASAVINGRYQPTSATFMYCDPDGIGNRWNLMSYTKLP